MSDTQHLSAARLGVEYFCACGRRWHDCDGKGRSCERWPTKEPRVTYTVDGRVVRDRDGNIFAECADFEAAAKVAAALNGARS